MTTETKPTYETWPESEKQQLHLSALRQFRCDWKHGKSRDERENCCGCCLRGYEPRGGIEPDYSVRRDGPNVAGWARLYVQAGYVPKKWQGAFERERARTDNELYRVALERDIATFGLRFA
jgi:hypothetical protein